jgi:pilus assembly protein CpaE
MSRIVLASPDAEFEQRIRRAFGNTLNGELHRWQGRYIDANWAAADLVRDDTDVVALGPNLPVDKVLDLAENLDIDRPEISVIIVAEPFDDLWEKALRAGAGAVLSPEAPDDELRQVIGRALDKADRRRSNIRPTATEVDRKSTGSRIITIVSPKGGSGKTTVASNVAVGLAQLAPGKVVVVDLDLQFGDVSSALRLLPEYTITDAARGNVAVDATTLKAYLTPHPSHLLALAAPTSPVDIDDIDPDRITDLVEILAAEFPFVVIDTAAGLDEFALAALEASTDVVVVCSMDVTSVRGLRKELDVLDQLGLTQPRHFVLNRADSRVGLSNGDIQATIGLPIDIAVSSSRSVPLSMNQGIPVIEADPRSPVSRQLAALVSRFTEVPAPAAANGGGSRFWRWSSR